ncbi:MAG: D-aminoacyl-tRNA deacylase [Candidatus Saccharicenans sp.]
MIIVLQRVKEARVVVNDRVVGSIGRGLCLLVAIEKGDEEEAADYLARKVVELRIFSDENQKMNLSLKDVGGGILAISQFTLAGSVRKGRRPSFDRAETPEKAAALFNYFLDRLREQGIKVESGIFQAMMDVYLVNEGPVTFILDTKEKNL